MLTDAKSWQAANGIHFALWGANTLGTPYKQNLTSVSAGIQIGGRVSENNQFWISIDANGKMYKTYYDRGTDAWSQWTVISLFHRTNVCFFVNYMLFYTHKAEKEAIL